MRRINTGKRFSAKTGSRVTRALIGVATVTVLLSMSGQIVSAEPMLELNSEMRTETLDKATEMNASSSQESDMTDAFVTDQPWDGMLPGDDPSSTPSGGDDSSTTPGGSDSSTTPSGDDNPCDNPDSPDKPDCGDKPATTTSKRKVLAYTGGDTIAFMAIGLAIMLIGAGLFGRNILAGKDK